MKVPRWLRWRMTLRCFFALLTAGCVWLGFVVDRWHRYERAEAAIEQPIEGNSVVFESFVDADGCVSENGINFDLAPPQWLIWLQASPPWLQQAVAPLVDRYYFGVVVGANFSQRPAEAAWQALEALPRVRCIALAGDWVNDETLHRVARLRGLQSLQIAGPNVTDAGVQPLAALGGLREVGLDCPGVRSGTLSTLLATLPDLKRLHVHEPPLAPQALERLAACPQLEHLDISGAAMSAEMAATLPSFPRLRMLHLQGTPPDEAHEPLREARLKLPDLTLATFVQSPAGGYSAHLPSVNEMKAGATPRRGSW